MTVLFWALLGGIVATALDALHVATGTLWYAHPVLPTGQDWWVPPEFAVAGVLMGMTHKYAAIPLSRSVPPPVTSRELAVGMTLFVGTYALSGLLWRSPTFMLVFFLALFAGAVMVMQPAARPSLLVHAAGAALAGPMAEFTISSTGLFTYADPDFGVPRWLPTIYMHAALASHVVDRWWSARNR